MSFSGHVYNRGLHCRPNIPPVYTTHHTRKQRQGDLSLFSRLLLTFLLILFFCGDLKRGAEISAQGLEAADGGRGCGGEGCEVR